MPYCSLTASTLLHLSTNDNANTQGVTPEPANYDELPPLPSMDQTAEGRVLTALLQSMSNAR